MMTERITPVSRTLRAKLLCAFRQLTIDVNVLEFDVVVRKKFLGHPTVRTRAESISLNLTIYPFIWLLFKGYEGFTVATARLSLGLLPKI